MLPASRAAWVPVFMATPTSACARMARRSCRRRSSRSACRLLLLADPRKLVLGLAWAMKSSTPPRRRWRRRERVVAGDHHGADAHGAELLEPFLDAPLDDVLEQDGAEDALVLGHDERRAPSFEIRSTTAATSSGRRRPARPPTPSRSPRRLCGCAGRPDRRRSCASAPKTNERRMGSATSRPLRPKLSLARVTMLRPSGVSSASEASCAESASC